MDQGNQSDSHDDKWREWYWKQAEQAQEDINSGADSFDKSMLTLSSGALGVSLAVIKDLVPLGQALWKSLLLTSWIAFALCITTTVVSFLLSIAAVKKHRELLDRMYEEKKGELANAVPTAWNKSVWFCTRIALVFFLTGLLCTMIFVVVNVQEYHGELPAKTVDALSITNMRYCDMTTKGQQIEKVVKPQDGVQKGRQPMGIVPPPKPPAPAPGK
jgi:hypothetical protein